MMSEMMGDEAGESPSAPSQTVTLSADQLPQGDIQEGTQFTFTVSSAPDSEGNVTGTFSSSVADSSQEEAGESWEDDFRKEMSPRNSDQTAP